MIIPDVNVLVHAWWEQSPDHGSARDWLEAAAQGTETLGLSELVMSGAVRVLTHPKVTGAAFSADDVLSRADDLRAAPRAVTVRPTVRHWSAFRDLAAGLDARGNRVPDCFHAALALEHDATWVSLDRFFETVPGLRWRRPW